MFPCRLLVCPSHLLNRREPFTAFMVDITHSEILKYVLSCMAIWLSIRIYRIMVMRYNLLLWMHKTRNEKYDCRKTKEKCKGVHV